MLSFTRISVVFKIILMEIVVRLSFIACSNEYVQTSSNI